VVIREKKQRHCDAREREAGDMWDHVALDPKTELVVALAVGKRTEKQTQ
jgi:hypothetical protein